MQYILVAFVKQKIRNSKMYTKTKFSVIFKFVSVIQFCVYNFSNDFCCEIQCVTLESNRIY